jgi:tetratricopeptide (TPR) repeat protein
LILSDLAKRVRELPPLKFQALALILARRDGNDALEEVDDTQGVGNGCDGVVDIPTAPLHAFQSKTVERSLGTSQKQAVHDSLAVARKRLPEERGRPLKRYTIIFNKNLDPNEAKWFAGMAKKALANHGIEVTHRGLSWVVDQLLQAKNDAVRKEYCETEVDRQERLFQLLSAAKFNEERVRAEAAKEARAIPADKRTVDALVTLLERASHHFQKGRESVDEHAFNAALEALDEALALLKRHAGEPLYRTVTFWRGTALLGANRWQEAVATFEEAERLFVAAGEVEEAHYSAGNRGHALHMIGAPGQATAAFREELRFWESRNDQSNALRCHVNLAMSLIKDGALEAAFVQLDCAKQIVERLPPLEFMHHYEAACMISGNLGVVLHQLERDHEAIDALAAGIAIADGAGDKVLGAKLRAQSAAPLRDSGQVARAEQMLDEAQPVFEKLQDLFSVGMIMNGRGLNAAKRGDIVKALDFLKRDAEISRQLGDKDGLAKTNALINHLVRKG